MRHLVFCFTFMIVLISCTKSEINSEDEDLMVRSARYFDASKGNNTNDGLTPETAWKDLDTVNKIIWGPGSEILLKAGEQWNTRLNPSGSGDIENPIVLKSYGEGSRPVINGGGNDYAIMLENQEYWVIRDIEITNFSSNEEGTTLDHWEEYNQVHWAEGKLLEPYSSTRLKKYGILVKAHDFGAVNHLHFINLEIHGINGDITDKDNGGVFIEITGLEKPTWFNNMLFENCYIHDVDRTGISNQSTWSMRTLETNTNWRPSEGVVFRNNRFERTGANALIVRVASSPLMEYNLFDHCAIKESGNASFSFNCDNALWQYNEARFTKYNVGDADAGGFDSDYRCKNTVIRYNYSHDNEYGGILVCCQGGDTRFNWGTIVCYNLFVNNENHTIRVSGTTESTLFHNNVVYSSVNSADAELIWHKSWSGYPDKTSYINNIFCSGEGTSSINLGNSTGNSFSNNIFYGNFSENLPQDQIFADPLFEGESFTGEIQAVMFMIRETSPAIDAGTELESIPDADYFGNTINNKAKPDIGIHEKR